MKTTDAVGDEGVQYLHLLRLAVFTAVAAVCFYQLGSLPLLETDEGFAANRAGSFLRHHSAVLSYDDLNDDTPQFHKPPLVYWMVAGLYKTLGYNVWSVRLPTAVCSFLMCLLLYLITRRHFGEVCGLWSALLPCMVPILLWHMRTAMLEMPLIFFTLLSIYLFAYARPTLFMAFLAGCAGGAAIMTKGPAGAMAVVVAVAMRLVRGPVNRQLAVQCLVLVAAAALPGLAFYAAVPEQFKGLFVFGLFDDGGQQQIVRAPLGQRLILTAPYFIHELRWYVPAALLGIVVTVPQLRKRPVLEWVVLAALMSVPVIIGASKLEVLYPRYLLPAFIFLLPLSVIFCARVTESRWTALWLAPFAVASLCMEPTVLRWAPAGAALIVLAGMQVATLRAAPLFTLSAGNLLLVAIVVSSSLSEKAHGWIRRDLWTHHPEVAGLARQASALLPPGERLIVGSGFTCHNAIFYSNHAVESFRHWLLSGDVPGAVRYGIFERKEFENIPYIRTQELAREHLFSLVRIDWTNSTGVLGVVYCPAQKRTAFRESLDLLGIQYVEAGSSFVVTNVPSRVETEMAAQSEPAIADEAHPRRLHHGDEVTFTLPRDAEVCGIDLHVADRLDSPAGLRIDVFDRATSSWRTVIETKDIAPQLGWTIENARLADAAERAVRFRFDPILTRRVRVTRTADDHFDIGRTRLFVTGPAG